MNESEHNLAASFFRGSDLEAREASILQELEAGLHFSPTELLGRSNWWGSDMIGAFRYLGEFEGKQAVLKVQGVKPDVSEAAMLRSFASSNRSALVRPPKLYASIPWSDEKRYEALLVEYINGSKLISSPTTAEEVERFFEIYEEYRQNCLESPWLPKPTESLAERTAQDFKDWKQVAKEQYPEHPHREAGDEELIQESLATLVRAYANEDWVFQHAHISADDVFIQEDQAILTSNLMWAWRAPFFDAVFAYHWQPYVLGNHYEAVTPELIEAQKQLWLSAIWRLPQNDRQRRQLNLALLERQTAGLLLDSLTVDVTKPIAKHLVQSTREEVRNLLSVIGEDTPKAGV